jgi:hypothetical protein
MVDMAEMLIAQLLAGGVLAMVDILVMFSITLTVYQALVLLVQVAIRFQKVHSA